MSSEGETIEKELPWFKTYPDRILSSVRWQRMKDYQRGWYWNLLLKSTRSKPLGYLPFDGQLWSLAGAHSRQFFEQNAALVLACFKVAEFDGQKWIYNSTMLKVLAEQQHKHDNAVKRGQIGAHRKNSLSNSTLNSYSEDFRILWENHVWKPVGKKTACKAYEKALLVIQEEKNCNREAAIDLLAEAMEAFKFSDAGKPNGLFDSYMPPYPASWLNAQRFFDDRSTWNKPANGHTTEDGQVLDRGYIPLPKKKPE